MKRLISVGSVSCDQTPTLLMKSIIELMNQEPPFSDLKLMISPYFFFFKISGDKDGEIFQKLATVKASAIIHWHGKNQQYFFGKILEDIHIDWSLAWRKRRRRSWLYKAQFNPVEPPTCESSSQYKRDKFGPTKQTLIQQPSSRWEERQPNHGLRSVLQLWQKTLSILSEIYWKPWHWLLIRTKRWFRCPLEIRQSLETWLHLPALFKHWKKALIREKITAMLHPLGMYF